MTLLEIVIALAVLSVVIAAGLNFITTIDRSITFSQDYSFAIQKSIAIISELRAYADAHESSGGASVLDVFDDSVGTSPYLTTDSTVDSPDHILSGNRWSQSRWYYARRITVRKFPSFEASNVRIVTVKIFQTQPTKNDEILLSDITSVVTTLGDTEPTTQVYDAYLLGIENIPGWWVYLAYLTPFIENALSDMESRNPGMTFRRHWVTKAGYGRDQEYKPYFNNALDSTQTIDYVYFYPGTMPTGSAVNQYYVPGNVRARINIDGVTTNDYDASGNPYPYALADQYNHVMRYPQELALYNARLASGQESTGNLTYRLLLDDMVANPTHYQNALFINLHGELIPMPSLRNYSDAAKDPAVYPQWRAVTHPEKLRYGLTEDVKLRVYAYLSDPALSADNYMSAVPITIILPDMNLTVAPSTDIGISCIEGGTDQSAPAGADTYQVITLALTAALENRMYATVNFDAATGTIISLYNTPLRTPQTGDLCGLSTSRRLYGMDYIPCPVEAAGDFSQDLTSSGNTWDTMAVAPSTIAAGGALASTGGDFIYGFRGNNSQTFSRYSISANSWTGKANYGSNVGAGGALVYVSSNGRIYGFRGNGQTTFRYYVENSWTARTAAPAAVGDGGALAYPGSGDFIYAFRGNNSTAFWRYSISGDSWSDPAVNDPPAAVGAGGALVYPGSGDYIYAFRGNTTNTFWSYSISGNSWTAMTAAPATVAVGGALVYSTGDDSIYAFRGGTQTTFWRCATLPKNTARWVITIAKSAVDRELGVGDSLITINTRIGADQTTGTMWPTSNHPTNLSSTYVWRTDNSDSVPFSERYQFQGDPRHCPYADVLSYHGYNWYFDNLRDASKNALSEWPGIDSARVNGGADNIDGWHGASGTGGDMLEIDVPRFFLFLRTALTGTNAVYTSITGFSYYYMGLGNEIGYDSSNGFTNSIPVSAKPYTGGAGSRNEDSITTAQTGGVKYIREAVTSYWWGKNWLGENYPDSAYSAQWAVNGNLNSGAVASTFRRIRRQDLRINGTTDAKPGTLPAGTTFYNTGSANLACVRRTESYGCTSLFNIGTTTSTFRHRFPTSSTGTIAADGSAMAAAYNFPLDSSLPISRPFDTDYNWGAVPNEFNLADYSGIRCTAAVISRFYNHNDGVSWEGSSLLQLQNPSGSNAFIVVNGLAQTASSGSAFIGRYAVVSLVHSFLSCGLPATPSRIVQLPRIEIKEPNVTTELNNPSAITITLLSEWKRWDEQKYTTAYADGFAETEGDLRYALLYSRDNGQNWQHIVDDSPATAGIPNQALWVSDAVSDGNETFFWDVSDTGNFPEGSYIIMVEAHRVNQSLHYSYHRQKIFINR